MTERKVLNKYFPPDFDPAKIPRLKGMKKEKVFSIRTMAPFNMMCLTCRGYIFKAKKFNSRMEECEYTYLDLKEYRFHIRCPTCCSEIVYRTDRENNDYVVESGAKRSFEAYTTAIRQAIKESVQEKEELEKNPIKALEKRTLESVNEFTMSSKIQDLMEQSKNDPPREELIEDTIARLRQKMENKKNELDQDISDLVKKQLKEQQRMELEQIERANAINLSPMDFSSSKFVSQNKFGLERMNTLKQMIDRKRKLQNVPEVAGDGIAEEKVQKCDINPPAIDDTKSADVPIAECSKGAVNLLGLDYDSSSGDE